MACNTEIKTHSPNSVHSPKMTVLMSVYNGAKYVREAIESILHQTFNDFEFLIINDGSNDRTSHILNAYSDLRVKIITNERNIGLTRSLNKGLRLAKGQYIARMDSDDISLPERLSRQVEFLENHPEVGVVGSAVQVIDASGNVGETWYFPKEHGFLRWSMCFFHNPIVHPSVMIRRNIMNSIGGYDESMSVAQDYELWSRISRFVRLANLQEIFLYLRKHQTNISNKYQEQQQQYALQISQNLFSEILDEDIARTTLLCLWKSIFEPNNTTLQEMYQAAYLIYDLSHHILNTNSLSRQEKALIRGNAFARLQSIATQRPCDKYFWQICIWMLQLQPSSLHKVIKQILAQMRRKTGIS